MRWENLSLYKNWLRSSSHCDIKLFEKFVSECEIIKFSDYGTNNVYQILKGEKSSVAYGSINEPPYADHRDYFKDVYGNVYYVIQPYYGAVDEYIGNNYEGAVKESYNMISEINEWCKEHNLKAHYYGSQYSWYYKGSTSLIIITLPDVDVKYFKS